MTTEISGQLDLIPIEETSAARRRAGGDTSLRLAFVLDARDWLRFLADEWWPSTVARDGLTLGVEGTCGESAETAIAVVVWLDPRRLPHVRVTIHGQSGWRDGSTCDIAPQDTEIRWPGPIPLSAVSAFSVSSDRERARLIAMGQSFSNVGPSPHPIEIRATAHRPRAAGEPVLKDLYCPPRQWNAIRGAAAMALSAVPLIDPWLDVFCEALSADGTPDGAANALGAPWLGAPIWQRSSRSVAAIPLWAAACEVLGAVNYREEWRPAEVLDMIVEAAIALGDSSTRLNDLRNHTHALLLDRTSIDAQWAQHDPLGLALQLVLLRPTADQYVTWLENQRSMPPAVWWTGAMLSGLVTGLRDLDLQHRGPKTAREFLAVRTWRLFGSDGANAIWPDPYGVRPLWLLAGDKVQFADDGHSWAERKTSRRGDWFRANFDEASTYEAALGLARRVHPSAVRRCLRIADSELVISGSGKAAVDKAGTRLKVKGVVSIALSDDVSFGDELDVDQFRDWIAFGSIAESLPAVPESNVSATGEAVSTGAAVESAVQEKPPEKVAQNLEDPPGLMVMLDFISPDHEESLIDELDRGNWLNDLSRRVQHYGWKYDYRARSVEPASYIGPLPTWAAELADKLVKIGLVTERPDQVIVNEYIGNQGIARHVDCPECFQGPIVTISLAEPWTMQFREVGGSGKVERVLPRRSAAVLAGEVRDNWTHEIPKRKKEGAVARGRRLSITFRRVNVKPSRPKRSPRRKDPVPNG